MSYQNDDHGQDNETMWDAVKHKACPLYQDHLSEDNYRIVTDDGFFDKGTGQLHV
jgi:hypothetical protein